MHILMVLTSHDRLGSTGEKTGFWLEEFAAPYYVFKDAGMKVTLASPRGGQPPLDSKSESPDFITADTERFNQDQAAQHQLANTLPLAQVRADNYDAVFYPGGHGPLWDLTHSPWSIKLIESFVLQQKPVSIEIQPSLSGDIASLRVLEEKITSGGVVHQSDVEKYLLIQVMSTSWMLTKVLIKAKTHTFF